MKHISACSKWLILALSLGMYTTVTAQWTPIKSLGVGPTDGCFSFGLHGKGYVGGGSNGNKFYEYDTAANTWTLKGNAPGNKTRGFGVAFVADGHAFAVGGDSTGANNPTADMWMYNDTTGTWTQKASFPGGGRDAMFAFVINDTAYVGGGFDAFGSGWDDFYKYNPFTDTWTTLSALPMGAIGFPVSFVIGNKGYVATGQVGSAESGGLWQYNPATNSWTTKTSFPGVPRQAAYCFALQDYAYVGGGMAGYDTEYVDMWRYNPFTDVWAAAPALPSRFPAWACAFTVGNTAFMGTGTYFDNVSSSLVSTDSFRKYWGPANPALAVTSVTTSPSVRIIPNPSYDYITIEGVKESGAAITIADMTGRTVKTFSNSNDRLYVGDLVQGIYLVRCVGSSEIFTGGLEKR